MSRRPARFAISLLAVLAMALGFAWGEVSAAEIHYAGLVVRHDDARLTYAYVGFTEDEINGIELLKRSGLDVVTIAFGGLGEGVCSIDEHGCPSTDCRKRVCQGPKADDPFWQYFRQTAPGAGDWYALVLGGSATKVHDGDIDGWSWTGTEPGLPALTLAEIAARAGYDGTSFDGSATPAAGAVFRRQGSVTADDDQSPWVLVAGVGVIVAAASGSALLLRSRRGQASALE
jgi:hypothetical protein